MVCTRKPYIYTTEKGEKQMISQINTVGLMGIDGFMVNVQTDVSNGMPKFDIIGLPDAAVKEAKERTRTAIKNSGLSFPSKHITINLAPASMRKEGSSYDLPIAISILNSTGQIKINDTEKTAFIGELSLDGSINSVSGVLPMVIYAYHQGIKKVFVPFDNADEAAIAEDMDVYPAKNLRQIFAHFSGEKPIIPHTVNVADFFSGRASAILDFADVKGQENVKRALEIAAAGNHNIFILWLTFPAYANAVISRVSQVDNAA